MDATMWLWAAIAAGVLAVLYGVFSMTAILRLPAGNARMQEIAAAIQAGAKAYLNRQYTTILVVGIVLFVVMWFSPLGWPTAGGFAVWTQLASLEDRVSTIDLRVDYLAPGAPEALYADAKIVRVGNRVGVCDVRCWQPSQPERTVATGKAVYNIKRKEDSP